MTLLEPGGRKQWHRPAVEDMRSGTEGAPGTRGVRRTQVIKRKNSLMIMRVEV